MAAIFGCLGTSLSKDEKSFFKDANPTGFILFARNCDTPDQIRTLVDELRTCIGDETAPVLIDQEGGRVARLRPPHWREAPSAATLTSIAKNDPDKAYRAVYLNARLIADELCDLGIDVDCAPVLDVPLPEADPIIGDRAYGTAPELIAKLGEAVCLGFFDTGVRPVIKHIPGHGRALVDSHKALPVVDADLQTLDAVDFPPFSTISKKSWGDRLWAMTAHVVYEALDKTAPATQSKHVIQDVIRDRLGFSGVLISDDLSMKALEGSFAQRAERSLAAGCDLALHCNGEMEEMVAVANGCGYLSGESAERLSKSQPEKIRDGFSKERALQELDGLLELAQG